MQVLPAVRRGDGLNERTTLGVRLRPTSSTSPTLTSQIQSGIGVLRGGLGDIDSDIHESADLHHVKIRLLPTELAPLQIRLG